MYMLKGVQKYKYEQHLCEDFENKAFNKKAITDYAACNGLDRYFNSCCEVFTKMTAILTGPICQLLISNDEFSFTGQKYNLEITRLNRKNIDL